MRRAAKLILAGLGSIGAGAGLALWSYSARWNCKTSQLVDTLMQADLGGRQETVTLEEIEQLPPPVARYFRLALRGEQPRIRSARIAQVGEFRAGGVDERWSPFKATQYFSTQPLGFVWDARIRMAPLVNVSVRDGSIEGQGSMQAKLLSLVPIIDEHGKAELNAGALQRYLAEAVWFPSALLPSAGVKWSAIDESRALATLTDSGTTVSLEFRFNDAGEIASVFTPARYREVNGKYELTPWEGHFRDYKEIDGLRIPVEANVEWQLRDGSLPYWKGRIINVMYDFA